MAIVTSITSGLWSGSGTWSSGSVPADNDTVVINPSDTVTYDYDNSSSASGINGLTISGTLSLTTTTGSYYMKIKAATTISGSGTFACGTSGSPIPFATKHTITGGTNWYINGAAGLTMTVFAAEPSIKTIKLSGVEAIGQTVLSVDTDVTGDIWAAGDTIRIDDISAGAAESEARVIAASGIAAGEITITAGLTAAKASGAYVHLVTRNVRFVGLGTYIMTGVGSSGTKLTIAGGEFQAPSKSCIDACNYAVISAGTFTASSVGVYNSYWSSISGGVFSGNAYGIYLGNGHEISGGTFTGLSQALTSINGAMITGGTYAGNGYAMRDCHGVEIIGGSVLYNAYGLVACMGNVKNLSMVGNTGYDITNFIGTFFNTLFGATTENQNYKSYSRIIYVPSYDHDQQAGDFKAWTRGGITSSQAVTYPTGYTKAMQTVLESATVEGFWQKETTVGAGASVNIEMWLRKSASMAYLPRCITFNKASTDPFAGGVGLNTFTMTNSIDTWESSIYTYTNTTTEDITLVIRNQGMNATGNMFSALTVEQINVDLTTAISLLNILSGSMASVLVDTSTDIPATLTTLSGSVTSILSDTGTEIPALITAITDTSASTIWEYPVREVTGGSNILLDSTQGAITWNQQKIIASVASEGAFHVQNNNAAGFGSYNQGGNIGEYNTSTDINGAGQYNFGQGANSNGQLNTGVIGQLSSGTLYAAYGIDPRLALESTLTVISGSVNSILTDTGTTLDTNITLIKAKTDQLAFTVTNQVDSNALTGGTSASTVRVEMDANSTKLADILDDTGTSGVALANDAITSSKFDELTAFPLKSADAGVTILARSGDNMGLSATTIDQILDDAIEGSYTMRQALKIILSAIAGKATGGGTTTITFRDVNDGKDRIVATVDTSGNRSSVVLDVT